LTSSFPKFFGKYKLCYISKSKLILREYNAFCFSAIAFRGFTLYEIKQGMRHMVLCNVCNEQGRLTVWKRFLFAEFCFIEKNSLKCIKELYEIDNVASAPNNIIVVINHANTTSNKTLFFLFYSFQNAGLVIFSSLKIFTKPCRPRPVVRFRPFYFQYSVLRGGNAVSFSEISENNSVLSVLQGVPIKRTHTKKYVCIKIYVIKWAFPPTFNLLTPHSFGCVLMINRNL
jgi:hypothetical protein